MNYINNLAIMQKINKEVEKIHLKNFASIAELLFEAHRHIEDKIEEDFRIEESFYRCFKVKNDIRGFYCIIDPPCMKTEKDKLEEKIVNGIIKKHPVGLKDLYNECVDIKTMEILNKYLDGHPYTNILNKLKDLK